MRPTETNLRTDLIIFWGSRTVSPFATRCSFHCWTFFSRSSWASVINQRELSTFAKVTNPSAMGNVPVGSACVRVDNVKNDSESKGVGACDRCDKRTENPTKTGSWVTRGINIVTSGRHRYCAKSFFFRLVNCTLCSEFWISKDRMVQAYDLFHSLVMCRLNLFLRAAKALSCHFFWYTSDHSRGHGTHSRKNHFFSSPLSLLGLCKVTKVEST